MPDYEQEKRLAAERSLEFIKDGMCIGLGSGSTARHFVSLLGERVRQGLKIKGIPTSLKTSALAAAQGIPLTDFEEVRKIDITVDGADEIDPQLNLIKGGGGALLREKIVASASDCFIVVADSRKPVPALGAFPLPIEVIPFGWQNVADKIRSLNAKVSMRLLPQGVPFLTMERNYILDCKFTEIHDPKQLGDRLRDLVGIVEHGLFVGFTDMVILGRGSGTEILTAEESARNSSE